MEKQELTINGKVGANYIAIGRSAQTYALVSSLSSIPGELDKVKEVRETERSSEVPLSGVRVLDMSRILAGPYCTMILSDLGADVIKVERPGSGDDTRDWGPPFKEDQSVYFMSVNRNKKSICVDFKTPKGVELIKKLAAKSDVLVENFLPGKLASMGLGYEDLKKVSPGLIFCSITGYGQSGPYMKRGGYDVVAAAVGGLMHITGPEMHFTDLYYLDSFLRYSFVKDGDPCRVGVALTDITTGLYAHGAIMATLIERQRTGQGKRIDCSLLASQVAVLSHIVANYLNAGMEGKRYGTGHASIVPYQAFKTSDGALVIGAGNDVQFKLLCKKLGIEELATDERFSTNARRVSHRQELVSLLEERLVKKDRAYWMETLEEAGIPFGPINSMRQVFEDPQVKHLNLVQELQHPTAGEIRVAGPAVKYNGAAELETPTPPPLLGEHTEEILNNVLELSSSEISDLVYEGIVPST